MGPREWPRLQGPGSDQHVPEEGLQLDEAADSFGCRVDSLQHCGRVRYRQLQGVRTVSGHCGQIGLRTRCSVTSSRPLWNRRQASDVKARRRGRADSPDVTCAAEEGADLMSKL